MTSTQAYHDMELIMVAISFTVHAPWLIIIFSKDLLVSLYQTLDSTLRKASILVANMSLGWM
jgi:hypothetical protein